VSREGVHEIEGIAAPEFEPIRLQIPLLGYHQVQNAVTAYAALQVFKGSGLSLDAEATRSGFRQVNWPGRFEILQENPPVVIDSAHNRDSVAKLRQTLDDYFPQEKVVLILGASEDKDIAGMFAELADRVDQVIVTRSYHPRSMDLEEIMDVAQSFHKPATIVSEVPDALDEAMKTSSDGTLVMAAGSIFIAAGIREAWMIRQRREYRHLEEESK
jgi:dihydrofolate synthase/folylpolyglutamate synthase